MAAGTAVAAPRCEPAGGVEGPRGSWRLARQPWPATPALRYPPRYPPGLQDDAGAGSMNRNSHREFPQPQFSTRNGNSGH